MDLERLTAATFAPHRGTSFRLVGSGHALPELLLIDVKELPAQLGAPRAKPFSLVFGGPRQPYLEQRTYRLSHADLGELEIFLVPIGYSAQGGFLYEAVFN